MEYFDTEDGTLESRSSGQDVVGFMVSMIKLASPWGWGVWAETGSGAYEGGLYGYKAVRLTRGGTMTQAEAQAEAARLEARDAHRISRCVKFFRETSR